MTLPTPWPELVGITWSVVRRAIGGSTIIRRSASGREARAGLWHSPMWEWDLVYSYLPDDPRNGTTASDFRTQLGFVLAQYGALESFPYRDDTFSSVTGQFIGAGDGAQQDFTLAYLAGIGSIGVIEPIGYLAPSPTLAVYLDGVLQTLGADYSVNTDEPYSQIVTLASPPAPGVLVTVDMDFYYQVRIKEDTVELEEFMSRLWENKKITLQSLKGD